MADLLDVDLGDLLEFVGWVVSALARVAIWLLLPWRFGADLACRRTSQNRFWRNMQALASWLRPAFWLALALVVCFMLRRIPS